MRVLQKETSMLTMHERETPVWDLVTRIFHWSLVIAFCTAQLTAEEWDSAHEYSGYVILGLVGFRLIWGLIGPTNVRFFEFIKSPKTIMKHLTGLMTGHHIAESGHNPAGGAMVVVLLGWLAVTALTGWMSIPLSGSFAEILEDTHEFLGEFSLLLVASHIAGVIVMSILERQNLAKSMIDGKKFVTK